jgi:hypothetical protein
MSDCTLCTKALKIHEKVANGPDETHLTMSAGEPLPIDEYQAIFGHLLEFHV